MSAELAEVLSSKGFKLISFGWIFFISENVILSENREFIISNIGSDNYLLLYSMLSTIASSSIVYGYFRHGRRTGYKIANYRGNFSLFSAFISQTTGLIIASQFIPKVQSPIKLQYSLGSSISDYYKNVKNISISDLKLQCPMDFKNKAIKSIDEPYGVERITRYPTYWSLGLISLGPALSSVYLNEVIMFSFPIVYAAIGCSHIDSRYRKGHGGYLSKEFELKTSNLPFVALLNGKQSWNNLNDEIIWNNASIAATIGIMLALKRIKY